jgi:tRNA (guanosine-2'-O-)-methyltransferase
MEPEILTNQHYKEKLLAWLLTFVSSNKSSKFAEKIDYRTRYLTIVLEDIFQPHNASAVLRSCDCFGIQDVHIIENRYKYDVNPDVALGSAKWLNLIKHSGKPDNTTDCIESLRKQGYRIVATTPHKDDYLPESIILDQKTALVFGTELEGLTPTVINMADAYLRIPMYGFSESLNISVSAALLLYTLTERLRKSDIHWKLTEEEKTDIMLQWAKNVVKKPSVLEREFIRKFESGQF